MIFLLNPNHPTTGLPFIIDLTVLLHFREALYKPPDRTHVRILSFDVDRIPALDAIVPFLVLRQTVDVSCCCRLSRRRHDNPRFFERRHLGVDR